MTTYYVFCYGTLRKNQANHHVLSGAICISEYCWVKGTLFDTKRGYPVLHKIDKLDAVYGELYQVDKAGLHLLDELEGYTSCEANDNLYERMIQTVFTKQGELDAFVYIEGKNQSMCEMYIKSGDWNTYCSQEQ